MTDIVPVPVIPEHPPTPQRKDPVTFEGYADAGMKYLYEAFPDAIDAVAQATRTNAIAAQEHAELAQQAKEGAVQAVEGAVLIVADAAAARDQARAWAESPGAPAPGSKSSKSHAEDAGAYAQSAAASAQAAGAAAGLPGGGEAGQALVLQPGPNPGDPLMAGWGFAGSQIGDVIQTVRNPGANYLVTRNVYLQSEYPELFDLIGLVPNKAIGSDWDVITAPAELAGENVQGAGLVASDDLGFYWLVPGSNPSTNPGRVVFTTDEGGSFSSLTLPNYLHNGLSVDRGCLVCTDFTQKSLFLSKDLGQFSTIPVADIGGSSNYNILCAGIYNGEIWAAIETRPTSTTNRRVGLWKSEDYGSTWYRVASFGFVHYTTTMTAGGILLVCDRTVFIRLGGSYFISQDFGVSFSGLSVPYSNGQQSSLGKDTLFLYGSPSPSARSHALFDISQRPPGAVATPFTAAFFTAVDRGSRQVFCLTGSGSITSGAAVRSDNGGKSFEVIPAVPTPLGRGVGHSISIQAGTLMAVAHLSSAAESVYRSRSGFDYDPATHFYLPGNMAPAGITEYVRAK